MKRFFFFISLLITVSVAAQKNTYDVLLFGKKIGTTVVERTDKGNGEIIYTLVNSTEVNILFTHKTSSLNFSVIYKNGQLFSSYCKNVKDDVAEIATVLWDGTKYVIKKGEEVFQINQPLDFSAIVLYFVEPVGKTKIFSERLGQFCNFVKLSNGEYQNKLDNGVTNTYRYHNGVLLELEMSKGASVLMKLVQ